MQLRIPAIAMAAALAAGCVSNDSKPESACTTAPATSTASTLTEESSAPIKEAKNGQEVPPIFVNLEPFTVNLIPETGYGYLQARFAIEVEDLQAEETINNLMPKIRNNLTLLLSAKKASELLSPEGKSHLADSLKDEINSIITSQKGKATTAGAVKSVLFNSFLIQ